MTDLLWLRSTIPCTFVDIHLKSVLSPFLFFPLSVSLGYLFPLCFQGYFNWHMTFLISLSPYLSQTGSNSVAQAGQELMILLDWTHHTQPISPILKYSTSAPLKSAPFVLGCALHSSYLSPSQYLSCAQMRL